MTVFSIANYRHTSASGRLFQQDEALDEYRGALLQPFFDESSDGLTICLGREMEGAVCVVRNGPLISVHLCQQSTRALIAFFNHFSEATEFVGAAYRDLISLPINWPDTADAFRTLQASGAIPRQTVATDDHLDLERYSFPQRNDAEEAVMFKRAEHFFLSQPCAEDLSFGGPQDEHTCIERDGDFWVIYGSERGGRNFVAMFPLLRTALDYLAQRALKIARFPDLEE